ncbi:MAG TPA: GIY-YIG nuclease family protein [Patescibacteria group bacterium]|nr:GIY-YIG nuclease family protein [Patescibacteria group bacterium]
MSQIDWKKLPNKPGVYFFKNIDGKVIYIGKAKDLRRRVSNYFSNRALDAKTLRMVSEAAALEHIVVASEVEAFLLESSLIKKYKPFFNILMTDDKSYTMLEIAKSPMPYVVLARRQDNKDSEYFGPFTSVSDLKIVLRLLRRIFPYHSVKNHPPKRCLYYHLGLCPCATAYPANLSEYKKNINRLIKFFEGDKENVIKTLLKEQKEFVDREEFEEAGQIQKQIDRINYITQENYDPFHYEEKPDAYFERIKNEVSSLSEILTKYGLDVGDLSRIECYDISNFSGKNATGSMVVFTNGDIDKSQYRRFKIKFKKTPDDFEMHREVARRRAKRDDWNKPNLMVIDGGKGQVSSVLQAHAEMNYHVPVIGLAKREETIVIPIKTGLGLDFLEVKLLSSTPGVNLLRRIRDEAHRFAITYHRLLRKKEIGV